MFAQVLQILLSVTILSTVAEQTSSIEINNEGNDSPEENSNQLVRRSLLNEKLTQNEDTYYRTFYDYSSETTTKPNYQQDIDTESVDYFKEHQELTTIAPYQGNSFVDERDLSVDKSVGSVSRKPKKYSNHPTNQNLYTNSDDKIFTYSKQPKPSSYDKVNDYDDAILEMQNLGSFGSKIHLKTNERKRSNKKTPSSIKEVIAFNLKKRKKPSSLAQKTNEIVTGLDVLNINEAITSDEDNSEENTKVGVSNNNKIQNVTEKTHSYIQTDKNVYYTAAESIRDNRISQVQNNAVYSQKPFIQDNLATDTTISEAVTPEYKVTKIPERKVTNLSKYPIVVPDIETTGAVDKKVTPTQYYFKTTSYTLKPSALAEALKGNFTNKLSGFKDTKSRVVVDIQKSVPIYLGSITKYLRNNFNNRTSEKAIVNSQQKNRNTGVYPAKSNEQYNLFPVQPAPDNKINYTESRLPPPSDVPYQFEVITPSSTPSTTTIQNESNVTEEYVLLPLDDAANSQIAPLNASSEKKEVQPNLYFVPQPAQNNTPADTRYYDDQTKENYNRSPDNYPQFITYTLPLPTEPPRVFNVPLNKHILLPEAHRPVGNNNLPPYMTPYAVPVPVPHSINQHHYLDSYLTFQQPPPVNIPPVLRHTYFPALPSNVKPEEPKVLPVLPLEFFQIQFPNFNQNKGFKRGRYDFPKINVPNFRKNRAKQVVNHQFPVHSPVTTQSPPVFTKQNQQNNQPIYQQNNQNYQNGPSNNLNNNNNNNNNLKLQRPVDLESSNSAKIEHYGHNFRSNRNARHNFDNIKMEYGFMPPLIPSMQIDEYGRPIEDTKS